MNNNNNKKPEASLRMNTISCIMYLSWVILLFIVMNSSVIIWPAAHFLAHVSLFKHPNVLTVSASVAQLYCNANIAC